MKVILLWKCLSCFVDCKKLIKKNFNLGIWSSKNSLWEKQSRKIIEKFIILKSTDFQKLRYFKKRAKKFFMMRALTKGHHGISESSFLLPEVLNLWWFSASSIWGNDPEYVMSKKVFFSNKFLWVMSSKLIMSNCLLIFGQFLFLLKQNPTKLQALMELTLWSLRLAQGKALKS